MATPEELNREKEINEALNERVGIDAKRVEAQQDLFQYLTDHV